jgi:hypothetical protein
MVVKRIYEGELQTAAERLGGRQCRGVRPSRDAGGGG